MSAGLHTWLLIAALAVILSACGGNNGTPGAPTSSATGSATETRILPTPTAAAPDTATPTDTSAPAEPDQPAPAGEAAGGPGARSTEPVEAKAEPTRVRQAPPAPTALKQVSVPDFEIVAYQRADLLGGRRTKFSKVFRHDKPVVLNFWRGQ